MPDKPESDSPYEFAPRTEPIKPREPAAPEAPAAPQLPSVEDVIIERTCPHCGFKIIGKPRGGRCPECAAALDEVATDLLQFSEPRWLITLSNGTLLFVGSILIQILAIVMVWTQRYTIGNALHIAGAIATGLGAWMAGTSEPEGGLGKTPMAPLVRIVGLVAMALWIAVVFGAPAGPEGSVLTRSHLLISAVLLATAVQAIVVGMHLRGLARRVPNDSLGAHLFNSSIIFAGCCLLMVGVNSMNLSDYPGPFFFFCIPLGGIIAVIIAWTIWTLIRIALEFRHCIVAGQTIASRQAIRAAAANTPRT